MMYDARDIESIVSILKPTFQTLYILGLDIHKNEFGKFCILFTIRYSIIFLLLFFFIRDKLLDMISDQSYAFRLEPFVL